jgi:hypothetical protein
MPKTKRLNKRGGFWQEMSQKGTQAMNSLGSTADNAGTGIQNFFVNGYNNVFKKKPTYSSTTFSTTGGKRKSRKRMKYSVKKGGSHIKDYLPLNNIASNASPVYGITSAKPHQWVGGKNKRMKRGKSRKNKK